MIIALTRSIKREAGKIEQTKNLQKIVTKDNQQGTLILAGREAHPEKTAIGKDLEGPGSQRH